ncbi:MAG: PorV/PorQ family protein [Balneolales bacterium]|nr:PorV/PorQ family protein [Balneolales bacterium]
MCSFWAEKPKPYIEHILFLIKQFFSLLKFLSLLSALLLGFFAATAEGQSLVRVSYGNDFMSVGSGARALGMGSAHTAFAGDVTAAYWNPAGLVRLQGLEAAYMHSERFGGIVGYDYGAVAMPLPGSDGTLAISFFRQGVDNIKNTLNAWDRERNRPRENVNDFITSFSAADLAVMISYGTPVNERLSWGASVKVLNSSIGPFANAWGYSLDLGAQYHTGDYLIGVNLMDITTMMKFWSVDANELRALETEFGDEIPVGENEVILPTIKIGAARFFSFGDFSLIAAADTDLRFENRRTYYINVGGMSIEPHIGLEAGYIDTVFLRFGLTDFSTNRSGRINTSPTLGAGLRFGAFDFDYGFSSFAGAASDLGFTHRLSLRFSLDRLGSAS